MILSEVQSLCAYDSLGRKTSRMDNDTWEYYIYDGMNLVADYDAYNYRITRTYTYGPGVDNIQSMTIYDEYGGSETYYYIKDASNTVQILINGNGEVVEYYYYDAFGNVKIWDENNYPLTESQYGNRFLFQGREYDYDTALYYFRNRWYEPETGRWLSPDPIGISGGLNLYAFCGNDPVNFVDPDGLWTFTIGAGIGKFAFKITIGENYGQKSLKINYGIGLGLDITFDPVETEPKELYYDKSVRKGIEGNLTGRIFSFLGGNVGMMVGTEDIACSNKEIDMRATGGANLNILNVFGGGVNTEYNFAEGRFSTNPSMAIGISSMAFFGGYYERVW